MLGFIKKLFGGKVEEAAAPAPYKVEEPKATSVAEQASETMVKSVAKAPVKQAPKKQAAPKNPAGAKKAPRKPKSKA
jgi:SepF-like predicted cell division protein (DUF552 family)